MDGAQKKTQLSYQQLQNSWQQSQQQFEEAQRLRRQIEESQK
jgi:hypothetical protein